MYQQLFRKTFRTVSMFINKLFCVININIFTAVCVMEICIGGGDLCYWIVIGYVYSLFIRQMVRFIIYEQKQDIGKH